MKLNTNRLTIGAIVIALAGMIGTVDGQINTDVILEEDVDLILNVDDTAVEIEWEEAPIAIAAGFKDASSLGKKGSRSTTKISKSNRKKFAKLFGFKNDTRLDKVKSRTSPVKQSSKKKVAKYFGYKDAAKLDKVKIRTSSAKTSSKKKVAKAFGFKDVASIQKDKKEVIAISKSDHKQLAKMFGFKTNDLKADSDNVKLTLDKKQKKLVAKAFGYSDFASLSNKKKNVKFTKSNKKELKKALKLK